MILLIPVVISMLVALVRGGSCRPLANVSLKYSWLILLGFLMQIVIFSRWWAERLMLSKLTPYAYILSMAALLVAVAYNQSVPGISLLGLGLFLNALTIITNGGQMPASLWALHTAGFVPEGTGTVAWDSNNSKLMDESTRLRFLGDILAIPKTLPFANVFSIGDILISAGGVVFVQKIMTSPENTVDDSATV